MARQEAEPGDLGEFQELARSNFSHLELGLWPAPPEPAPDELLRAAATGGSLPYDLLDPYAFERLCFHLLLARETGSPRFWGRRGQAQQGIDLILSNGTASVVYQCKHAATFGVKDLAKAVRKFRDDWLSRPELGRPETFVLCTSAKLTLTTEWEAEKIRSAAATGVAIEEWHRDTLDGWLRGQPGIVAELFGERVADLFCGLSDVEEGLFQPIRHGAGDVRIDRFVHLSEQERLVRDSETQRAFDCILGESPIVLIGGRAGAGKTIAAIDLAGAFDGGSWRVLFARADAIESLGAAIAAIRRLSYRPSIFIIDDCHLALDKTRILAERLIGLQLPVKLVLTARTPPEGMEYPDAGPDEIHFLTRLEESGQTIDVIADERRYRALIAKRLPKTVLPIDRVMAWTGGDLAILDLTFDAIASLDLSKIDRLEDLFPSMRRFMFGERINAPELRRLAAFTQFDVAAPEDLFSSPFEAPHNATAAARFVFAGGRPSSLAFHHSSAAELMFRLLAWGHGEKDLAQACARDCADLLCRAAERHDRGWVLDQLLRPLLAARLNLSDDRPIKRLLLSDPRIIALVTEGEAGTAHPALFSLAAVLCRDIAPSPPYASSLLAYLQALPTTPPPLPLGLLGMFLRHLALADPEGHQALVTNPSGAAMARLIGQFGSVLSLLSALASAPPMFSEDFLQAVEPEELEQLAAREIESGNHSVGALNLSLQVLGARQLRNDAQRTQLHLFEEKLGQQAMVELLARSGLVELLRVVRASTGEYAEGLLTAFGRVRMETLVAVTMAREAVSIRTLSLSLRPLGVRILRTDARRTQLQLFEDQLGAAAMARLIAARGGLLELVGVLAFSSASFAEDLLLSFDAEQVAALIETTAAQRDLSLRSLALKLRELGTRPLRTDRSRTQLHLFEQKIGAASIVRLIVGREGLVELVKILSYCTPGFAENVLRAFDPPRMSALIDRSLVGDKSSIRTLALALRELGARPLLEGGGKTQLNLFEEKLGAQAMARLIVGLGAFPDLLKILQYCTEPFAVELLQRFGRAEVDILVDATLANQNAKIGFMNHALRALAERRVPGKPGLTQRRMLEDLLGADGFWRLVHQTAGLTQLSFLLGGLSSGFRDAVLASPHARDQEGWSLVLQRCQLQELVRFIIDSAPYLRGETAECFERVAEACVPTLAVAGAWTDLGLVIATIQDLPEGRLRTVLADAVGARIAAADVDTIAHDDFVEVSSAISALWRARPELRARLGDELWRLLPNERTWPRTPRVMVGGRILMNVARSSLISQSDAQRLLQAFAPLEADINLTPSSARSQALFLWNLFAFWSERFEAPASFQALQHPRTWDRLLSIVEQRLRWRRHDDRLDTLMLAGALAYLLPVFRDRLRSILRGQIVNPHRLVNDADRDFTFIPAFFVFQALALDQGKDEIFTPRRIAGLFKKAAAYDEPGPALEELLHWLHTANLTQLSERWGARTTRARRS